MREIGGYIEFERYRGEMLHGEGIKLDCGRSCLIYLISAKKIRKLLLPYFMCDSVIETCQRYKAACRFYNVGPDLRPGPVELEEDEYLYLTNYYGQLSQEEIKAYCAKYGRVIVDNAQAYFAPPLPGVDTIYTCRKFFGVPDGAVLFTDAAAVAEPKPSESYDQMTYLLGRFERTASEFYEMSVRNNKRFRNQPARKMSKLTENLLHSFDYAYIQKQREDNFRYLGERFAGINRLKLTLPPGPYAYPLMLKDASNIRKELIREKIYIPVLWPNVLSECDAGTVEYDLAMNILPLPCDQRYDQVQMEYIAEKVLALL